MHIYIYDIIFCVSLCVFVFVCVCVCVNVCVCVCVCVAQPLRRRCTSPRAVDSSALLLKSTLFSDFL
jgi:hypothetical protein